MKLKISIYHTIIFFIVSFLLITAATIILLYSAVTKKSVYSISEKYMNEVLASTVSRTEDFFSAIEVMNKEIAYNFWNPQLFKVFGNNEEAFQYFKKIAVLNDQYAMVYFATAEGNMVMARRMPDNTLSKRVVTNDGMYITETFYHENQEYNVSFPSSVKPEKDGYDPRRRGWFIAAKEKKSLVWTDIYKFATGDQIGISCALPIYNTSGLLMGVSCLDVTVNGLSEFLDKIQTTPNTILFILDQNNQIIAEKTNHNITDSNLLKKITVEKDSTNNANSTENLADNILTEAFSQYNKQNKKQSFAYTLNGKKYFSNFGSAATLGGFSFTIGMIVPDTDIMGAVYRNNMLVLIISFFVIVLAVFVSAFVAKGITKPLALLSNAMDKIKSLKLDKDMNTQVSVIYEIAQMNDAYKGMVQGLINFQKYVPTELVNTLLEKNQAANIGGEKKELTVFFSDIANFTSISEMLTPEKLILQMNEYFEGVSNTILENEGTLDKYIGDAVMAFWGAPKDFENHAELACKSALICKNIIFALNHKWEIEGRPTFFTRMGLHTDTITVGNMGYEKRMNYTVLGDGVNLASRLEGINKYYGTEIIISANTQRKVKNLFETRLLDKIAVKGKLQPIYIYELLAEKNKFSAEKRAYYDQYEQGLNCYFNQEWDKCIRILEDILKQFTDNPSKVIIERAENYKKIPPPKEWDGVYTFDKK